MSDVTAKDLRDALVFTATSVEHLGLKALRPMAVTRWGKPCAPTAIEAFEHSVLGYLAFILEARTQPGDPDRDINPITRLDAIFAIHFPPSRRITTGIYMTQHDGRNVAWKLRALAKELET